MRPFTKGPSEVHLYHHIVPDTETVRFQDEVLGMLRQLTNKESTEMSKLDDIKAEVTKNRDGTRAAIVLIQKLTGLVQESVNDPAALQTILDEIKADTDELGAAVVAGTPAAPAGGATDPATNPNVNT